MSHLRDGKEGKSVSSPMVVELTEGETDAVTDPELDQIGDEEIEAWCSWLDRYRAIIKVRSCVYTCV